jgi:S-DNA-T family DNA segregation ATPase FtsK/SpoIIIE
VLKLQDAWAQWSPDCTDGNQEIVIGVKEDDGSLLIYSPRRHAPHALIAGSTGSGKSVLMQNIILSLAATNSPYQAEIIIIDPKQVDYLAFSDLPHLKGGIIDEQGSAIETLNSLIKEMDRRYALLKSNRVTNIFDLYKKEGASEKPPVLWVIHDEFAEWMMTDEYKEAVGKVVSRLGVKARAAGIFLIFAAQRPDSSVMPMQLRSNLGNRLILKVDSEGTSEISLGERGAERLLGKGHMCAKLDGEPGLIFSQVPFLSSEEIEYGVQTITRKYSDTES